MNFLYVPKKLKVLAVVGAAAEEEPFWVMELLYDVEDWMPTIDTPEVVPIEEEMARVTASAASLLKKCYLNIHGHDLHQN